MFSPKTLSFLRALKRNNDREWFRARKADYERHVRGPMVEVIARLAVDLRAFAPELIADPKVSLFRPYRDTRFSGDKSPIKTAVGARFPSRHFARGEGAGLYFEVAPGWVWIGGGMYMPSSADLYAIREEIASSHPKLHRLATSPAFKRAVGELTGERLSRVPRGYLKDHPAAHYLQFKQFLGACEYEASFASSRRVLPGAASGLQGRDAARPIPQSGAPRARHASAVARGRIAAARSPANRLASSGTSADVVTRMAGGLFRRKRSPAATAQPRSASACTAAVSSRTGIHTLKPDRPCAWISRAASASIKRVRAARRRPRPLSPGVSRSTDPTRAPASGSEADDSPIAR